MNVYTHIYIYYYIFVLFGGRDSFLKRMRDLKQMPELARKVEDAGLALGFYPDQITVPLGEITVPLPNFI